MMPPDQDRASDQTQVEAYATAAPNEPPESPLDSAFDSTASNGDDSFLRLELMDQDDVDSNALPPDSGLFRQSAATSSSPTQEDGSTSHDHSRATMTLESRVQLAFSAMQYLPVPVIILDNRKTIVMANEAMARLLGFISMVPGNDPITEALNQLRGQTLSQVGVNMLTNHQKIFGTRDWSQFFDLLAHKHGSRKSSRSSRGRNNSIAPLDDIDDALARLSKRSVRDSVVDVSIACKDGRWPIAGFDHYAFVKMMITVWEHHEEGMYFTLTFSNEHAPFDATPPATVCDEEAPELPEVASESPKPPKHQSSGLSMAEKLNMMKDAVLDSMRNPAIAMWKDGSVVMPNKTAKAMMLKDTTYHPDLEKQHDLHWELYTEDFSRLLELREWPLYEVLQTERPTASKRCGIFYPPGRKMILEIVGETISDPVTGEFLAGAVFGQDFTAVKDEIDEMKERDEARFRAVCESMPHLVWLSRADGPTEFFNQSWYSYTGLRPEQCIGTLWPGIVHQEDEPELQEKWQRSINTGEPFEKDFRLRRADGVYRWYLGRAAAVRDKHTGQIERWFGTCHDIDEMKLANLRIKRTRQQLLSVLGHSLVTIFTVDSERRVTMLEGSLIWNAPADDNPKDSNDNPKDGSWYIGQDIYDVFSRLTDQRREGERPEWLQSIEEILDGRVRDKNKELVKEHEFDHRWHRTRFIPILGKGAKNQNSTNENIPIEGVIGVIMDVTELKDKGEALREQSKEKHRAMAMAAAAKEATRLKSQFLANMSHEIRTPIAGVLGMAELLGDTELNEEQQDFVTNIQSSATSLLTVINDILDFSKVESGRLDIEQVQFSLTPLVQEIGRMLQFAVKRKNLDFQSDIGADIADDMVVIGDPGRLRQIIVNLLTNSIKFTNQGHVRFSMMKEKETEETIEVKFVVQDTGVGIEDSARRKLFKPFFQGDSSTARRFGGTGLGLTICKNLLDLMNGSITLESTLGSGTTATFWIPFLKPSNARKASLAGLGLMPDRLSSELILSRSASDYEQRAGSLRRPEYTARASSVPSRAVSPQPSLLAGEELPFSKRAKMHVLVVDDNPVNQKIASRIIGKLGFQVSATWNGKEALNYMLGVLNGQNARPDIILMDVQMPIIDGYKCTHLLRHHLPYKNLVHDVPIVAVTASAIQGDHEKCTRAGMDDYLAKPVTMKVLEKMLIKWSLSRRVSSPSESLDLDCLEGGEHCDHTHIPQVGYEPETVPHIDVTGDFYGVRRTPRPFTPLGQRGPLSPFPDAGSDVPPNLPLSRRPTRDREWLMSSLQDGRIMESGSVVLPSLALHRRASFFIGGPGELIREENGVHKLESVSDESSLNQ